MGLASRPRVWHTGGMSQTRIRSVLSWTLTATYIVVGFAGVGLMLVGVANLESDGGRFLVVGGVLTACAWLIDRVVDHHDLA